MKYPKLKCEDKKNTTVCSADIKKMKKLRKKGYTDSYIGKVLKVGNGVVGYHISPIQNSQESLEKRRKRSRKYQRKRYNNDPEFRRKMLDSINSHHREKYATDSKWKKWSNQISNKYGKLWRNKQKLKHPNWSSMCKLGSHVTSNRKATCKNSTKTCKCPCHK